MSFSKKLNKIGIALTTFTKRKKRGNSKTKMRIGRENNKTDNTEIHSIIRDYCEHR